MDWYGYWARVNEDPEAYAEHFGGGGVEDDHYDEHGLDKDYGWQP